MTGLARIVLCACFAAAAACGGRDPVSDEASGAGRLPETETQAPDPMTGAGDAEAGTAAPRGAADRVIAQIPAALRGRWGLTPADCVANTPSPSVLVVTEDTLRFHESIARPARDVDSAADFISGEFAFQGEGQAWIRFQSLQLTKKDQLLRSETNPPASYTYVRCTG